MIHLTTHQLSSHLDGELPESSIQIVGRHLESCEACTRRFAALREQEAVLDRVLANDPGEEFFARFADQVLGEPERAPAAPKVDRRVEPERRVTEQRVTERRVQSEPRLEAERRAAAERRVANERRVAAERRLAAFRQVADEGRVAAERSATDPQASARLRPHRQPAIPWFAAAVLCLVMGAIGYMLPRPTKQAPAVDRARGIEQAPARAPEIEQAPEPVPAPRHEGTTHKTLPSSPQASQRSATDVRSVEKAGSTQPVLPTVGPTQPLPPEESIVPVRRILTTTEVRPAPASPVARSPARATDEFAAVSDAAVPLIAAARRASSAAARDSSAANLDAVGDAWEQVVPTLNGTEQTIARQDLAEARFRAWVAAPDPYRAAAATASLRSFVVLSPPGPRRDLAKEWLRRINGG